MARAFELVEDAKNFYKLVKSVDWLKNNAVYVGIPQAENEREEQQEITNAELLYIHTNGSEVNHIPARPVIEPAIEKDQERLSKMLLEAAEKAVDGNNEAAIRELKRTGMRAQNVCRAWFVDENNGWPPDSPKTIAAKKRKHKNVKNYEPRTLIDTAQMRNAITYFVEIEGEGRQK